MNTSVKTYTCSQCYLCDSKGTILYEKLYDRLFGVPGKWNLRQCCNPKCGLVWLDPMPVEEDISQLYQKYYTHQTNGLYLSHKVNNKGIKKYLKFVLQNIFTTGYDLFTYLIQIKQERERIDLMYLQEISPGKLLDVGCGDGSRLAPLQALGWEIRGQEIDPNAAQSAIAKYQIPVHIGTLASAKFPDNNFDAIIMNHVIEHVSDPIQILAECHRILKPGGILIGVTPNIESSSHHFFGQFWRGLEPPRHLHLFSKNTLQQIAIKAGFNDYHTWTTAAHGHFFALSSLELKQDNYSQIDRSGDKTNNLGRRMQVILLQLRSKLIYLRDRNTGDECVLKAIK